MTSLRRFFYSALPHHALSRLGARAAKFRAGPLAAAFIRWFVRRYDANLGEAVEADPHAYPSFNAFFTRALNAGARPMPDAPDAVISPVDGVVSACGSIAGDTIFQAKGADYSAAALLGNSRDAELYKNGRFATIYLRPGDYHRVHTPLAGRLKYIRHIPGRLWPVRPWAVESIPGLFTRNERLVLEFTAPKTSYALVMVGALLVGGLETVVTGPVHRGRREPTCWNLEAAPRHFERGEEIGRFNFGSTVILLFPQDTVSLSDALGAGAELRLGEMIGIRDPGPGFPQPDFSG
ncbi:MAG: archaetidylserine decarboxylase [Gammaproteobacteria bacterium]